MNTEIDDAHVTVTGFARTMNAFNKRFDKLKNKVIPNQVQ